MSAKGFAGDINIETHKIVVKKTKIAIKRKYTCPRPKPVLPNGKKWLNAVFDYLNDHNVLDKLAYIQIGNESRRRVC